MASARGEALLAQDEEGAEALGLVPSPCCLVQLQECRALLMPSHSWPLRKVRPRNRNVLEPSPLG